ncbi:hypothetical protein C8J56DRAFT_1058990 [Mycena floridula]|nr:hypothetical protein C8J56DRAFT_1058990 [Mycena floridula]
MSATVPEPLNHGLHSVQDNDLIRREIFLFAAGISSVDAAALSVICKKARKDLRPVVLRGVRLASPESWESFLKSQQVFGDGNEMFTNVHYLSIGITDGPRQPAEGGNRRIEYMYAHFEHDPNSWKAARSPDDQRRILRILGLCTDVQSLTICFRPFQGLTDFIHDSDNLCRLVKFQGLIEYLEADFKLLEYFYDNHNQPDSELLGVCESFLPRIQRLNLILEYNNVSLLLLKDLDLNPDWVDFFASQGENGSVLFDILQSLSPDLEVMAVQPGFAQFPSSFVNGEVDERIVFVGPEEGGPKEVWKRLKDFIETRSKENKK